MTILYRIASRPAYLVTAFIVLIASIFLTIWLLLPGPPKTLTIATGFPDGLYHQFAKQLQVELAKEKIVLRIQNTGGSVDNLALMADSKSGVDLAIIQSGVGNPNQYPKLTALAGLFYEPLWVWYRPDAFIKDGGSLRQLSQLKGKKVSIGNEGSGTNMLSQAILKLNDIESTQLNLVSLSPDEAIKQLRQGGIDVAMIVLAGEAPLLKDFYQLPGIRLMDFDQAETYTRVLPYLNRVDIPRGLVSIAHDLPKQDIHVIAPTATLVAHSDINPATVSLLLGTTYDILRNYSRLQKPGEFPSSKGLDFPIDLDAEIFLKDGPSFFYRHLPFWGAVWLERVIKILIPLLIILLPIFTYLPVILNLSLKIRLGRLYKTLKTIEKRFAASKNTDELLSGLNDLENRIERLNVSAIQSKELYDLRMHIALVRDQLKQAK
ncbi:MAG: C4-dicarboxylate ABC transporter substrate-binding protein [Burkholderiaceae bacterium]|jgi:TRAP transporter TAXI family solute receptor|uniref:TAXI family TRAP transporter solute-binding subunit n=1 Tax=Polynucleobacter sp. MWH-UH24A TaxID=2689110 RepID=UPI001BFDC7FE|nr:TAXI family TRAP transporter solute-binding subunit [Polynucleobacter sp. MWH-UH24A]NCX26257.1 C4-dicarboxylate ABC transporter substrate-binding protein [Burkholderiaceae bacterium]NCZ79053.1 C4-dicarboxylate ABC transporter substrate-binding protein [Burkholderiaceae bacterium]NDC49811.1 C4-dicarboxylate ABC transporter substrate-binding protein [Burkholderiaceae bacterium]NDC65078.1 C4-dicarboxylate ABC transporter substrate-binding protein [Burkholderiaceae bacterium]NDE43721.1 C4-dicar